MIDLKKLEESSWRFEPILPSVCEFGILIESSNVSSPAYIPRRASLLVEMSCGVSVRNEMGWNSAQHVVL
jgi:hypothetical protein